MTPSIRLAFIAASLGAASPAFAQSTGGAEPSADQTAPPERAGGGFTIGLGGAIAPSYEGSDDYVPIPAAAFSGKIAGVSVFTSGLQLYADIIPAFDNGVDIELGPVAGVRLNRTGRIIDDRVRALGKRKAAFEVGGFAGISKTGVITSDFDKITARVTYLEDVSGIHESYIISPSIEYGTPFSTTTFASISASADFVGDGYGRTYFDVDAPGSIASGLPVYRSEGGLKSYTIGLLGAKSLTGDLRGGLSLFALGSYTRLLNDFSFSPVTRIAGDPNQLFGGLGLGYTF